MPQNVPELDGPQAEPAPRGRPAAPSRCAAPAAVVKHGTVSASPAGQEAITRLVGLLARQQAQEDFSSQGDGA